MSAWSVMRFQADGFQACHVNPLFSISPLLGESVQVQTIPYSVWEAMEAIIYMILQGMLYMFLGQNKKKLQKQQK